MGQDYFYRDKTSEKKTRQTITQFTSLVTTTEMQDGACRYEGCSPYNRRSRVRIQQRLQRNGPIKIGQ